MDAIAPVIPSTSTEQDEKTFAKNVQMRNTMAIPNKPRLCRKTKAEALAPAFAVLHTVRSAEAAVPATEPPRLAAAYCFWIFRRWKRREMGLLCTLDCMGFAFPCLLPASLIELFLSRVLRTR